MKYEGTISDNKDLVTKQYVDDQDTTKEAVANKVTSFSATPDDTNYPSEKLVYDNLATKEATANRVTSITSSSDDQHYPTAKAVYDLVQSSINSAMNGSY